MNSKIRSTRFIILFGLCLMFLSLGSMPLAWAGELNQTVPTAPATETPTFTLTSTSTATATATHTMTATPTATLTTATLLPSSTATEVPVELPAEIIDDSESLVDSQPTIRTTNMRTFIGAIIVIALMGVSGIGGIIWLILKK